MKAGSFRGRGGAWVVVQFILFAVFLFVPPVGPAWPQAFTFRVVGAVIALAGIAFLVWSFLSLGRSLTPFPRPLPSARLVTTGMYRLVRHPIYFGLLLGALGLSLLTLNPLRLVVTLVLAVFLDRKAEREERWLLERYPHYGAYRRRVRKLIPWIY